LTITTILIAITVAISFFVFNRPELQARLMMNPFMIHHSGQYYRFITSGFIHINHVHLLMNMLSFYFLGTAVEQVFHYVFGSMGTAYYVSLYLMAIAASDLPTYFKQKENPHYNSLGASGGVAAIVFAFIIFQPMQYICIFIAICMPGFILGALYIAYSYYQGKKSSDNINHDAHLFGALFGLVFCVVIYPASISNFTRQVGDWLARIFQAT
jgi:membrane associated rhomboid family serine protease